MGISQMGHRICSVKNETVIFAQRGSTKPETIDEARN